jgi:hypothetical protein
LYHFSGKIWAPGGDIIVTHRFKLETADSVWHEGRRVYFDGHASSGFDGFDFKWMGRELVLDLQIDGKPSRKMIFIGTKGIHPANHPFVIYRLESGPRPKGKVWVPGHYGPGGRWIPGHWR